VAFDYYPAHRFDSYRYNLSNLQEEKAKSIYAEKGS